MTGRMWTMPKRKRLRVKRLHRVGFVDRGDDPEASIVFFKHRQLTDEEIDIENVDDSQTGRVEMEKALRDSVAELRGEIAKHGDAEAALAANPGLGEKIEKAASGPKGTVSKAAQSLEAIKVEVEAEARAMVVNLGISIEAARGKAWRSDGPRFARYHQLFNEANTRVVGTLTSYRDLGGVDSAVAELAKCCGGGKDGLKAVARHFPDLYQRYSTAPRSG